MTGGSNTTVATFFVRGFEIRLFFGVSGRNILPFSRVVVPLFPRFFRHCPVFSWLVVRVMRRASSALWGEKRGKRGEKRGKEGGKEGKREGKRGEKRGKERGKEGGKEEQRREKRGKRGKRGEKRGKGGKRADVMRRASFALTFGFPASALPARSRVLLCRCFSLDAFEHIGVHRSESRFQLVIVPLRR